MKVYHDGRIGPSVAAERLGLEFHEVLRLVQKGLLPAEVLPCGAVRIDPDGVEAMLARDIVVQLRRPVAVAA